MSRKPRILLIPNVAWWIIGEMGEQISARFGDKYDFYLVPEGIFERRPDLLRAFIPAVDAIHCLNESSIELFRDLQPEGLPPIATWIHHVTEWSPQHQLAAERSAALTVCTEGWRRDIAQRVPNLPITVIPHGVDLEFFRRRKVPEGTFGIPPNRFVIGFLGTKGSDRDRGRKGTDTLLEVIRRSAAQLPDVHVVLGGPGWESEVDGLRSLGVSVSATGYVPKPDLPLLYSALDVYLMTSRVEGGPCTVFEAMACGTPVVATRVGAVPDLIVDGVNGYSAEVDDVDALVAAVVQLDRERDRHREIARHERETISQWPWRRTLTPLGSVYDSLIRMNRQVEPGPAWLSRPSKIHRASSAADAVSHLIMPVREGKLSPSKALRSFFEMANTHSPLDLLRGIAMLRGWSYRPDRRSSPARSAVAQNDEAVESVK
jgi:glycosyltransferase involved in cell wall biosynthesis